MHFENLANASHLTDRYNFWKKYAYLWGAAADTGYNFNMLIIFIAFSAAKTVTMPNWWGNNAKSVERCTYFLSSASMTSSLTDGLRLLRTGGRDAYGAVGFIRL